MRTFAINQVRHVKVSDEPLEFALIRCQLCDGKLSISAEPEQDAPGELQALRAIGRIRKLLINTCVPHETLTRRKHRIGKDVVDRIRLDLCEIKRKGQALPISLFDDILPLTMLRYL